MAITEHLSDSQLGEVLPLSEEARQHLAICATCRLEHERLRNWVGSLSLLARSAEQQPETFWEQQRFTIQSRISNLPEPRPRRKRLVWATAFAIILFASLILKTGSHQPVQRVDSDLDRELLVQVEQALSGDVPQALQPASLLADEINQAVRPHTNSPRSKETTTHEN